MAFRLPRQLGYTPAEAQYDAPYGLPALALRTYASTPGSHQFTHDQPATSFATRRTRAVDVYHDRLAPHSARNRPYRDHNA
jgi:hypothetical protein